MTHVFLSTLEEKDALRTLFYKTCMERWGGEGPFHSMILSERGQGGVSQLYRRTVAENNAETDIYVLADDDCLPQAEPFLDEGVRILEEHSDFAILSMMPTNCKINPWKPDVLLVKGVPMTNIGPGGFVQVEDYSDVRPLIPYEDADVMEHVSVGGIRFCRKGCLEEWPPFVGPGYDREQCDALRAAGFRVGYFKNLTMLHLGEGYSQTW